MTLTVLDHVNIRTARLEDLVAFYRDVLGLHTGWRPAFSFGGAWLYCGEQAVVHLVEVDEQPILFIAPSTGGKSTLGDYFLKQGHPMLSDDKVATFLHEDEFWAVPSHPHHRPFREF